MSSDMSDDEYYKTPEQAALSGFSPSAEAHVVSVEILEPGHARVIVDTVPSHPILSICFLTEGSGWWESNAMGPVDLPLPH